MNLSKALRNVATAQTMLVALWVPLAENAIVAKVKAEPGQLESAVRGLIEQHCGSCHNSTRQTAKPGALKVFDLNEHDWTARMSNDQLKKVIGRANGTDLPPAQRQRIADYINQKLKERAVP